MKTALVCGAGGFIGSHMVKRLKKEGYWVRGVDLKYPEFSKSEADEFVIADLRSSDRVSACMRINQFKKYSYLPAAFDVNEPFDEIYQFAADMGGAGYVFTGDNDAVIMHNSVSINLNVLENATTEKIFYSSSACMYPQDLQTENETNGLKESDAYPANPDSEYGWEKLFSERLYMAYGRNKGIDYRIARFHNIYGEEGTFDGGKEKAPAAMCRKVWEAEYGFDNDQDIESYIEVWGTGNQTRSFLYIEDCIIAVRLLMQSDHKEPINIGSEESISINGLAKMAIEISGKSITIKNVKGAVGVNGRNSDNTLIEKVLGWKPQHSLKDGMTRLYKWIDEVNK